MRTDTVLVLEELPSIWYMWWGQLGCEKWEYGDEDFKKDFKNELVLKSIF